MSKLVSGLKEKNKLEGKVGIYLPKDLFYDFYSIGLKKIEKFRNLSELVKFCISFYAYHSLDLNRELYGQLKYSEIPNKFFDQQETFREKITLKEFEENFIKVEVLNWHLIICLSKCDDITFENNFDIIRRILMLSWENLDKSEYWRREERFRVGVTDIFQKNIHQLKILHGNYSKSTLIKKCLQFYAFNVANNKNLSHLENYSKKYAHEINELTEIELLLPDYLAETLNFHYNIANDIQKIIDYNLMVFKNLFPERSINIG
ncbi:hypothetical protein [Sporomusa aerivorans]|uniref:hypothetical protein n=1 Tax=Sporomusa aerivorans TaxID=204936 RepID=UPI00352BC19F